MPYSADEYDYNTLLGYLHRGEPLNGAWVCAEDLLQIVQSQPPDGRWVVKNCAITLIDLKVRDEPTEFLYPVEFRNCTLEGLNLESSVSPAITFHSRCTFYDCEFQGDVNLLAINFGALRIFNSVARKAFTLRDCRFTSPPKFDRVKFLNQLRIQWNFHSAQNSQENFSLPETLEFLNCEFLESVECYLPHFTERKPTEDSDIVLQQMKLKVIRSTFHQSSDSRFVIESHHWEIIISDTLLAGKIRLESYPGDESCPIDLQSYLSLEESRLTGTLDLRNIFLKTLNLIGTQLRQGNLLISPRQLTIRDPKEQKNVFSLRSTDFDKCGVLLSEQEFWDENPPKSKSLTEIEADLPEFALNASLQYEELLKSFQQSIGADSSEDLCHYKYLAFQWFHKQEKFKLERHTIEEEKHQRHLAEEVQRKRNQLRFAQIEGDQAELEQLELKLCMLELPTDEIHSAYREKRKFVLKKSEGESIRVRLKRYRDRYTLAAEPWKISFHKGLLPAIILPLLLWYLFDCRLFVIPYGGVGGPVILFWCLYEILLRRYQRMAPLLPPASFWAFIYLLYVFLALMTPQKYGFWISIPFPVPILLILIPLIIYDLTREDRMALWTVFRLHFWQGFVLKWMLGYGVLLRRVFISAVSLMLVYAGLFQACSLLDANNVQLPFYGFETAPEGLGFGKIVYASEDLGKDVNFLFDVNENNEKVPISNCRGFLRSLYFSVVTFTTLGYGDYRPEGLVKYIAGAEALTGALMIALLVVVFARRFLRM